MNKESATWKGPDAPLCWFCALRPPDKDSASKWEMYREFEVLLGTVWSFEPTTVPVPRCARCKQAHDRREGFVGKGWKVGLWLGMGLGGALFVTALLADWGDFPGVLLKHFLVYILVGFIFFCAVVGGIVGWLAGKSSLPRGIKDQSAAVLHPNVKGMEAAGWKLGSKPPRR